MILKVAVMSAALGVVIAHGFFQEKDVPVFHSFGYAIKDKNGEQFREESGFGGHAVKGSYGFTDDRGVYTRVNYVADKGGFRAQVINDEQGTVNQMQPSVIPSFYGSGTVQANFRPAVQGYDVRQGYQEYDARRGLHDGGGVRGFDRFESAGNSGPSGYVRPDFGVRGHAGNGFGDGSAAYGSNDRQGVLDGASVPGYGRGSGYGNRALVAPPYVNGYGDPNAGSVYQGTDAILKPAPKFLSVEADPESYPSHGLRSSFDWKRYGELYGYEKVQ